MIEDGEFSFQNQKLLFLEQMMEIYQKDSGFWEMYPELYSQAEKVKSLKEFLVDPYKLDIHSDFKFDLNYDLIKTSDSNITNAMPFCNYFFTIQNSNY